MALLTFGLSITLDGCVDHQSGLPSTWRSVHDSAKPLSAGAIATHYAQGSLTLSRSIAPRSRASTPPEAFR